MQRAIELAQLGLGSTSPNPMVGCVIVHENKIIGEGWHQKYGEAHAEVHAIRSVEQKHLLAEATAYVSLEPCSHFGKTPPCADLLIQHKLKRVVVCNKDPFPAVNGTGIEKLKAAGIDVEVGILEEQGRILNKRFFTFNEKKRPFVILKWAESADGFVALENGQPVAISGPEAQQHSHKWRTEEAAILVGANTVLHDNPELTARHWTGRNPIRVVLDLNSRISAESKVLNHKSKTIVFTETINRSLPEAITQIEVDRRESIVPQILDGLYRQKIDSVLVEGGPRLHRLFLEQQTADEIRIFKSKALLLGKGIHSAPWPTHWPQHQGTDCGKDILHVFSPGFQPFL
ncbi:bifunctional diaminohydroxyphosphoribosylaminopyrimidine deaminase/5-amino-6-(5-phosphoribosylamino)uracil reductase RibD [Marinilongibacter aquaticus]|uniref:bifunctional diaminohydroxyphosphoribosylaminopyrimidine deaminase/5-amino-6-(5-phosphoribosylamino)uracil reductase RibD n=1 Tax=Marinilongibacter aquaticus TaxID=2975157 RepID=UPI0021BD1E58|nr:bifunctional diaminohydroxyphosphoribosylaminopyrimidine deaminase/5-amino-6-(5-phosphoribosylamino)uracil reductase RibD [Marinilongibacter aquaticus]UBM57905.1 bifunctional diaminohydroxyphosphoribosylaminopyrimidine deaminase/5-amino-6-(5-phosphoribosylamino)uracil reductase RibD [Marinilongibacter aquaticus]